MTAAEQEVAARGEALLEAVGCDAFIHATTFLLSFIYHITTAPAVPEYWRATTANTVRDTVLSIVLLLLLLALLVATCSQHDDRAFCACTLSPPVPDCSPPCRWICRYRRTCPVLVADTDQGHVFAATTLPPDADALRRAAAVLVRLRKGLHVLVAWELHLSDIARTRLIGPPLRAAHPSVMQCSGGRALRRACGYVAAQAGGSQAAEAACIGGGAPVLRRRGHHPQVRTWPARHALTGTGA